jgi:hypothetical protein
MIIVISLLSLIILIYKMQRYLGPIEDIAVVIGNVAITELRAYWYVSDNK